MGYMRHHAIVVTSWSDEDIARAHAKAREIFEAPWGIGHRPFAVSPVLNAAINMGGTFIIPPDGSKEGWSTSDDGDYRRSQFIAWLETTRYEDGSGPLDWVEIQYGDDDLDTRIVRDSDAAARARDAATKE